MRLDKLVEENQGNRIIVVTTPDVVQAAIALTLNLTPENQFKTLIKTPYNILLLLLYFHKCFLQ